MKFRTESHLSLQPGTQECQGRNLYSYVYIISCVSTRVNGKSINSVMKSSQEYVKTASKQTDDKFEN